MRIIFGEELREIGTKIFASCGALPEDAALIAEELTDARPMGLDSHGITRIAQYAEDVKRGSIRPNAPIEIVRETDSTAVVDCGWNFGIVAANRMVDIAEAKAQNCNIACVTSLHAHHIGRLGSYVQKLAERGLLAFAVANGARSGHWVAPWGGSEGRLATNPLAFAAPTSGDPVVLDMSTSMIAEGKIRALMQQGKSVPEGCILDAKGRPTVNPADFYGPPMGTILPFGGTLGYKGFGLSLMAEILGSTLGGTSITPDGAPNEYLNGFTVIAIRPEAFSDHLIENMDILCAYITSCIPAEGSDGVAMPGYYDFAMRKKRQAEGIPVAEGTWDILYATMKKLGIEIDKDFGIWENTGN